MCERSLKLRGMAKFNYFWPLILVASFPFIGLAVQFFSPGKNDLTLPILIPIPIAALLYWHLNRSLRYRMVRTNHSAEENFHSVVSLAHRQNWKIKTKRASSFIQAKVGGFPKTMSWGEQVSVQFNGFDVYVNSICDPDEPPSLTSFGQNAENIQSVVRAVSESTPIQEISDEEFERMEVARKQSIAEDEKATVWWARIAIIVGAILVVMLICLPSQPGASPASRIYLWGSALTALSWGWSRNRSKRT